MKTKNKHWVDEYLVPLGACNRALEKANKYPDPQTAWDSWERADDMLWALVSVKADPKKLISCMCESVERVLFLFKMEHPDNNLLIEAIASARSVVETPTKETDAAVYAARKAIKSFLRREPCTDEPSYIVAVSVLHIVRVASHMVSLCGLYIGEYIEDANSTAWLAAEGINTLGVDIRQVECIRKHFPNPPIEKKNELDN